MNYFCKLSARLPLLMLIVLAAQDAVSARPPVREAPSVLDGSQRGIGRTIPDVEFTDLSGSKHRLSQLQDSKAVVIFITGTSCPLCRKFAPSLADLEKQYSDKGIDFVYVNPNKAEKLSKIEHAIQVNGFQGPYVRDAGHHVIRSLQAKTTTEAFVLDRERKLIYQGAVDDQYGFGYALNAPRKTYLRDALDAVLADKTPLVTATTSPGCELWIEAE